MTATTTATRIIQVRTSPHVHSPRSVDIIMHNVIYALLPLAAYGVLLFGWSALALMATTTGTCVLAEHLYCRLLHRESSVNDYSVAITGLLLGLILPPGLPLWMGVLGSLIGIHWSLALSAVAFLFVVFALFSVERRPVPRPS